MRTVANAEVGVAASAGRTVIATAHPMPEWT